MGKRRWFGRKRKEQDDYQNVLKSLKRLYTDQLLPLEVMYRFHDYYSAPLTDADFDAKPMVLLIGQYSTGKTSFIKYVLGRNFPGMRIGPEPTTDGFMAIMQGEKDAATGTVNEGIIPGHALISDNTKPFKSLGMFGNSFVSRFIGSTLESPVLENISLIDSPGILAGRGDGESRGYDYGQVLTWFAERVDRILMMFDVNKLDISDEFLNAFELLTPFEGKIRIVLNKCDLVSPQHLMRVYGALMWSLGKITKTPEVTRVFIGSFWDEQLRYNENRQLFEDEKEDLLDELKTLPRDSATRKLNDLMKRIDKARMHAYIISTLKQKMCPYKLIPAWKRRRQRRLTKNLSKIFDEIGALHGIPRSDFPEVAWLQDKFQMISFTSFRSLKPNLIMKAQLIKEDTAILNQSIRRDEAHHDSTYGSIQGGVFHADGSPFAHGWGEGIMMGIDYGRDNWIVGDNQEEFDEMFEELKGENDRVSGFQFKQTVTAHSKLTNKVLARIWLLADYDKDGHLDSEEFALAMYLLKLAQIGEDMPDDLPPHLIPLSQRTSNWQDSRMSLRSGNLDQNRSDSVATSLASRRSSRSTIK